MASPDSRHQFASDNYSGICPEAWEAMAQANSGHAPAYGNDRWTAEAADALRELFETDCEAFFVFNGTAANSLALASLCQSYHSVMCHEFAHVETDECGGPEFFSNGTKVLLIPGQHGRIDPAGVTQMVRRRSDIHFPKPKVLTLTQATELGTVYTPDEVAALGATAKDLRLRLHMDGARFANAVATLGVPPKEITWKAGVDVLCFGGTKNGMPVGECVVFFKKELAHEFDYRCKQAGQLASKMRFLAAPWAGMLKTGAWLENARHANRMAKLLYNRLQQISGATIMYPVQANSVFVRLPDAAVESLANLGWRFYNFIGGGSRFMCSWDTTDEDVQALTRDIESIMSQR